MTDNRAIQAHDGIYCFTAAGITVIRVYHTEQTFSVTLCFAASDENTVAFPGDRLPDQP